MGTNCSQFIAEANRILKVGGTLRIAEVQSRMKDKKVCFIIIIILILILILIIIILL